MGWSRYTHKCQSRQPCREESQDIRGAIHVRSMQHTACSMGTFVSWGLSSPPFRTDTQRPPTRLKQQQPCASNLNLHTKSRPNPNIPCPSLPTELAVPVFRTLRCPPRYLPERQPFQTQRTTSCTMLHTKNISPQQQPGATDSHSAAENSSYPLSTSRSGRLLGVEGTGRVLCCWVYVCCPPVLVLKAPPTTPNTTCREPWQTKQGLII